MRREWRKPIDQFFTQLALPPKNNDDENELTKRLDDWGFNFPKSYVLSTFKIWYRSGYKVYPNEGSWNDQDPQWCEDMATCLDIFEYHKQRIAEPKVILPRMEDL